MDCVAHQIVEWIFKTYPEECQEKPENSPVLQDEAGVLRQITSEISKDRLQTKKQIKVATERPRKFYYTEAADRAESNRSANNSKSTATSHSPTPKDETALLLSQYLKEALPVYSKRIEDKQSSNSVGC